MLHSNFVQIEERILVKVDSKILFDFVHKLPDFKEFGCKVQILKGGTSF